MHERLEKSQEFAQADPDKHLPTLDPKTFGAGSSQGMRIQGMSTTEWIQSDNPLDY